MTKFLLLFLSLLTLSGLVQAQTQDSRRKVIVELCGQNFAENKEGTGVVVGDWKKDGSNYCIQVTCKEKQNDNNWSEVSRNKCISEKEYKETILRIVNNDGDGSSSGGSSGGNRGNGGSSGGGRGGNTDGDGEYCEYVIGGAIPAGHPCAKACRKHWLTGKEGAQRQKCRECVEKYSTENGGDLIVDWSKFPGGRPSAKKEVKVTGVGVRTEIICYDANGRIISRVTTGSTCPSGSSTTSGGRTSSGGTGIVISGRGSVDLPDYCIDPKDKKDRDACDRWMRVNQGRFACSSSSRAADCMGDDYYHIQSRYDRDCPGGNCKGGRNGRGGGNAWLGDALGALFTAGGQVGAAYFNGRAIERSNQAWAGAAAVGFEQCQISQNNYLSYLSSNELPALSPDQRNQMNCNGYNLGAYGGLQNGGLGAWYGAGYTPGMIGGMMGPYGGYNPYGGYGYGGNIGGVVGGIAGGYVAGGYVSGYAGGYAGGGAIQGAVQGGGFAAGYAGGYAGGGYVSGYAGGYAGGGFAAGYAGGYNGGGYLAGGVYAAGGFQGGAYGGYMQGGGYGGFVQGGGFGGYGGNPYGGGYGGYGSGVGGFGGFGGYGGQGNYWGASNGYNAQMDYSMSMNASNYDRMIQQQGMNYQAGMGNGNFGGGYGSAGFYPGNAGFNLNIGGGFGTYGF